MGLGHSPAVVSEGLVFYFDPINTRSYAGTGLTGFNLIDTSIVGAFTNSPVYDAANKGSIYFDGVDDRISFSFNSALDISQSITIEAYIKPQSYPTAGGGGMIVTKVASYYLEFGSNGKIRVYFFGVNSPGYHESVNTVPLNKWTHTVVTRDISNNTINIYINGILDKTVSGITGNISVQQTHSLTMGGYNGSGYLFVGLITCGKIYNRALSSTEVLQNYNATKKRFSPEENIVRDNLILNLDAGNNISYSGTGTSWFEISGSGSTATLISTTFSSTNGGAFVFNGTSSYASLPTENRFDLSTGSATIAAWFKTTSTGFYCIASKRNGTGFQFYVLGTKLYADGAGTAGASSSQSVNTGNNFYGAVVYDRANSLMRLYVNGVQDGSVALASTTLTDVANVNIGRATLGGNPGDYFNGTIYQVQIYNKALSSAEILQNYNALKGRYGLS